MSSALRRPRGAPLALLVGYLVTGEGAVAQTYRGNAQLIDADTLRIAGRTLNLFAVDALETGQTCSRAGVVWACGQAALRVAQAFVEDRTVECHLVSGTPDALQARCHVDGLDLGAELIGQGLALRDPPWVSTYARVQHEARQRGVGIWDGSYQRPSDWRAANPAR